MEMYGRTLGTDGRVARTASGKYRPPQRVSDKRAIESHRQQQLAKMLAFYSDDANIQAEKSFFGDD
jgi:hypothetical protein